VAEEWGASPLLAPLDVLRTLPTTLLLVAGVDTYYEEQIRLHEKLQEAGVDVYIKEYPRAVHPFMSMDKLLPSGKQGMEDLVNFVKEMNEQPVSFVPNAVLNIGY
jgi:acetyl esterase/lipase